MKCSGESLNMESRNLLEWTCCAPTGTRTQNIMTIESMLPWCETLEQGLLLFADLTTSQFVSQCTGYKPNSVWSGLKSTHIEIRDVGSTFSVLFNSRGAVYDRLVMCCTHALAWDVSL